MNRWLALGLFAGVAALPAAAQESHFDDPGHLLPSDPKWRQARDFQLTMFEQTTGIMFLVRIHPKSPSSEEDKVPGIYMRALAQKLGIVQHGILLVYFADEPDWRVWIGDDLVAEFAGKPGTVQELTDSGAIHDVKEALLTRALAEVDKMLAPAPGATAPSPPWTPTLRLNLQVTTLIGDLIKKFPQKKKQAGLIPKLAIP